MKTLLIACMAWMAAASAAPASSYSDFNAGVAARNDHDYTDAIRFMNQALAAPDLPAHLRPTAFQVRAQAYREGKKYDLAIADYSSLLALRPANYDALMERGAVYAAVKNYALARADFAGAIRVRPELEEARVAHAACNIAEDKLDDAIKDYDDAIASSPENVELIVLRGNAKRIARRYDAAIADFTAAIGKDSHYSASYSQRALTHIEAGDLRAAISDYDDAIDIGPNDAGLREAAGVAQWEYGDYRAAERSFEKSAADPERAVFSQLWLYLTNLRRDRDDGDFARHAAKLDLKTWPGTLLNLYIGGATVDDVFAAAKQGDDEEKQKDQLCEANFFVAEWHLGRKEDAAARPLLEEAASSCNRELLEAHAARSELGKLKP
jgi:lipoprotein NlpI